MHRHRRTLLLVLAIVLVACGAGAQDVYVTAPYNKIVKVDFDTGDVQTVVRDRGTWFRSVAVRGASGSNDLRLLATNAARGGDIRVYDETTGAGAVVSRFSKASGLALGVHGDVFATNQDYFWKDRVLFIPKVPGCADVVQGPFAPDCGPGGYGAPTYIDQDVRIPGVHRQMLADVRQAKTNAPGLFSAGQLLVLVKHPAMVLGYSGDLENCDGACEPEVIVPRGMIHQTPTGFDIAGDSLLITTWHGEVLKVTANGQINVEEFYSLPGKGARISVGADDGTLVAYPTVPNKGGRVLQLDAMTGVELDTVRRGIRFPVGVGAESSNVVAAPAGNNIEVLLPQLKTTFEELTSPGLFGGECKFYDHPTNPGCDGNCPPFLLSDLDADPPFPDVLVESHWQPFRVGDKLSGPLQYLICRVSTSGGISDLVTMIHDEETSIGYTDVVCESENTDTANETRMAWAPDFNDIVTVNGMAFTGVTAGCGNSHRGFWKGYSVVMPIVKDQRPTDDNIAFKQEKLGEAFEEVKSDIIGECPMLTAGGGPVSGAFATAGLDANDWSYVGTTGAFGGSDDGANGWLADGAGVEFQIRNAGFKHAFGTSDLLGETREVIVADSSATSPGATFMYSRSGPYHFYFENIQTFDAAFLNARAYTDSSLDTPGLPVEVAVYRNIHDPYEFALFFEDYTDNEFSDMVVTARGTAEDMQGTQCQLESAIAAGDAAVFEGEGIDYRGLIESLANIISIVDANPDDFLAAGLVEKNTIGELKARAGAEIFQACKPILSSGDVPEVCPVQPEDHHEHDEE